MPSQLGNSLKRIVDNFDYNLELPLNDVIQIDPGLFYEKLGYLRHPYTGKPVTRLADYQIEAWKAVHESRRVLVVKSNKIGLTTSTLMLDLQLALLPTSNPLSTRGYDQLLIAQTKDIAKEHLRTLRKMIIDSPRYSKYLIDSPSEIQENGEQFDIKKAMRSEQTKTSVIYIRNPENERAPSRIIALGMNNPGAILSWRNVKHLHISDPTAAEGDIAEGIDNALSRLANTNGTCIIETIPSEPVGKIWEMYQSQTFKTITIPAEEAVQAGVISREFLNFERQRLGVMYPRYYEARFTAGAGNIFSPMQLDLCTTHYDLTIGGGYKILSLDPAFGSSKFAVLGIEHVDGVSYVKEARQFDRPTPTAMIEFIQAIVKRDGYDSVYVDSAHPGIIADLQARGINAQGIVFRQELGSMIITATNAVKECKVRIHPSFIELLTQLKTASFDANGNPDKSGRQKTLDLLDAFLMAVSHAESGGGYGWVYLPT